MVRNKLFLLTVFCLIIFTQSCVHGSLEECPPMVNYAVAFEFTHHMYQGDRFLDDVKKINLFVFDERNLVYTTETAVGPYDKTFNIPLTLPMGKYHIIAWGNVLDNGPVSITPNKFEIGVTTLKQAQLILQRDANDGNHDNLEKIFYGERTVEIPLYISRIDTIPLINNTHNVRVVVHWDHTGAVPQSSGQYIDVSDVHVNLHGTNAVYDFDDKNLTNIVHYAPHAFDRTGDILKTDIWEHTVRIYYYPENLVRMDSSVYDFKVLRLFPNQELILSITQENAVSSPVNLLAPIGSVERKNALYGVDIVGHNTGDIGFSKYLKDVLHVPTTVNDMLSTFDKYDNYRVDVTMKYDKLANTYFSITEIKIQDWHRVEEGEPGWAD